MKDATRRRAALALLAAALVCAVLGQYAFVRPDALVWDGIAWYVAAGALLAAAMARRAAGPVGPPPRQGVAARFWALLGHNPARAVALALALAGSACVAALAPGRAHDVPRGDLLIAWAASVALALGAFVPWRKLTRPRRRNPHAEPTTPLPHDRHPEPAIRPLQDRHSEQSEESCLREPRPLGPPRGDDELSGTDYASATTLPQHPQSQRAIRLPQHRHSERSEESCLREPRPLGPPRGDVGAAGSNGLEAVLVAALALAALLLRLVNLETIPYVLSGDEASMGLEAVGVLEGARGHPFVTGWLSHPTLYFHLLAASLRLFGVTVAALRLPSALVAAPTVILLYLLARRYYGRWVAGLSALFFVGYHYAIHYSRIALNNIWDPFFALGALYFGLRGVDQRRPGLVALGGAFLGLAWYFYMGARLIPLVLLVGLWLGSRGIAGYWRDRLPILLVMGLCALIVALPILAHFYAEPTALTARWKLTSMLADDALATEVQRTGRTPLSIMGTQFLKAALAFHHYPDPTYQYRPGVPLLGFSAAILLVFGLVAAARQFLRPGNGLLVSWFVLVIVFGGALLENPPNSARLVLAIPPVAIAVALGAVEVSSLARWSLGRGRAEALATSLVVVLLVTWQSAFFYLARYTPSRIYGGVNTAVAHSMGLYLRDLGPGRYCYFLGAPRMYLGFATIPYLARHLQGSDVLEPLSDASQLAPAQGRPVFILLPERADELAVLRRRFPSGELREFRDASGDVLFMAYEPLE